MSSYAVLAAGVAHPEGTSDPVTILVDDGRIAAVLPGHPRTGERDVIGDGSDIVAAGLIDIHTHGAIGVQTVDTDQNALRRLSAHYASHGVTGFLATIGGSNARIEAGLSALRTFIGDDHPAEGAICLGIHLEGPFINSCCRGAFPEASVVAPDVSTLERYASIAGGELRLMTVAPEVDGQLEVVQRATALGVVCSAGHSAADEAETIAAIDIGVESMTHMFNAMAPLHHRSPGIVAVGLTDDRVTTELIADGVHVSPRFIRLLAVTKGWNGIALVSDSIAAAGLDDGSYLFEEQQIEVRNGEARLADGTLAGSTLKLDTAVRNFSLLGRVTREQALASASLVPARTVGLAERKGRVREGFDADIVGFDRDHDVRWTMVGGDVVFRRDEQS